MPSRSSASSSATTTRSTPEAPPGTSRSAGVRSLGAMSESAANRGPVADAQDLRRVEHAVARILAETEGPCEVYEATRGVIGRPIGWPLGAVWELDPEDGCLHCVRTWRASEPGDEFQ